MPPMDTEHVKTGECRPLPVAGEAAEQDGVMWAVQAMSLSLQPSNAACPSSAS